VPDAPGVSVPCVRSTAKRKVWETENPVLQKFTKTDVAKYEHIWGQLPHVACKGAEKNFVEWTLARTKAGAKLPERADFEALCAKALLFKSADTIIRTLDLGGYKANVVAYTLAWLSRATNGRIDLRKIWQKQAVSDALKLAIKTVAPVAYKHLVNYAAGGNVTEVAKKEDCWMTFRDTMIDLPPLGGDSEGAGNVIGNARASEGGEKGVRLSSTELQESVQRVKLAVWLELAEWGDQAIGVPPWQVTTCRSLHTMLQKGTRLKQDECKLLVDMLTAARAKGFHG